MKKSIFREKSIDRISSPEEFDEYVKVSNLSVWGVIIGSLIVVIGFFVWSIFGRMETTIDCVIDANEKGVICYVNETDIHLVKSGMPVRSDDSKGVVTEVYGYSQRLNADETPLIVHAFGENDEEYDDIWAGAMSVSGEFREGIYKGSIVVEEVRPIDFLVN